MNYENDVSPYTVVSQTPNRFWKTTYPTDETTNGVQYINPGITWIPSNCVLTFALSSDDSDTTTNILPLLEANDETPSTGKIKVLHGSAIDTQAGFYTIKMTATNTANSVNAGPSAFSDAVDIFTFHWKIQANDGTETSGVTYQPFIDR